MSRVSCPHLMGFGNVGVVVLMVLLDFLLGRMVVVKK